MLDNIRILGKDILLFLTELRKKSQKPLLHK